ANCKHTRSFRFLPFETQAVPAFALAPGDQPSRVFTAEQLRAIADRELALALADPSAYSTLEQYEAARTHVIRGRTALVELAKFRPGMTGELAAAEALWKRYKQAKPAVEAKPGALPEPRGLGERLKQHRAWDLRGRAGDGRLTFRTESWNGLRMPSVHLEAAIIEDTTFERMDLSFGKLTEAVIQRSKFLSCLLTYGKLGGARVTESDFNGSSLVLADLHGIQVQGGDWRDLEAARSTWNGAHLTGVDLQNAELVDVILDNTTFERCDLRGADLGRRDAELKTLGIARRTRFIGCDLRGARIAGLRMSDVTFERCQLDGLIGDPVIGGAVTIDGKPWLAR
ncbi:MAG TPA: pentapeptide repeat-containing protein, partial [Kofleriaceae bacterium]